MQQRSAGARVRRLRTRRALTQEQLAEAAGVAIRTVQRAEDGSMSAETVAALAAALEVPVETLTAASESGDYPQITPMVYYADVRSLDWLVKVFGLTERTRYVGPDGRIQHAELCLGEGVIMAIGPSEAGGSTTPAALGGASTQSLYVMVDDVDEHCEHAREHGAEIITGPENAHGHRRYLTVDPEGHHWQFWTVLP
ncbi:helix-turn-helix domain-containing protein [Actinomadura sp. KC06]|uniref:VOC family protein n=1 Tax=Actinomadura sp. KC06 TaxID=2530369 RepID=UPI00104DA675|nr:VOC family protein [Actinomadura sp. KC06]TDD24425.1 helix-turn-helix domain-containing protein [Actinomadura sp. KC06]